MSEEAPKRRASTDRDEAMIALYFRGLGFDKSTFGPMIARADRIRFDSEGHTIAAPTCNWNFPVIYGPWPKGDEPSEWKRKPYVFVEPEMQLASETDYEPGYEMNEDKLLRFSESARLMLAVERISVRAKMTLEAYFGDRGNGWTTRATGYSAVDPDTKEVTDVPPMGPGRIAAVYALTEEGHRFLEAERGRGRFEVIEGGKARAKTKRLAEIEAKRAELTTEISRVNSLLDEALKTTNEERIEAIKDRLEGLESDLASMPDSEVTAHRQGPADPHRTDDELLHTVLNNQTVQPNQARAAKLQKVRAAAEKQLASALEIWVDVHDSHIPEGRKR